jgi:hypothetical protein
MLGVACSGLHATKITAAMVQDFNDWKSRESRG